MRLRDIWPWLRAEFRWRVLGENYVILLTEEAQRQLDELPEEVQVKIRREMHRIARNPYSGERMEIEEKEAESI